MTGTLSSMHELMVVCIQKCQLIESCVLHRHRVLRRRAGGAVVPWEEDGGPPIVEAETEDELVVQRPGHQRFNLKRRRRESDKDHQRFDLWLANLLLLDRPKLGRSKVGPVGKSTIEIAVVCVVPSLQHEAVRVEGWKKVNLRAFQQPHHLLPPLLPAGAKAISQAK